MKDKPDNLAIRLAQRSDVPALAALFADDALGGHGDTTDPAALPAYQDAFDRIAANPYDTLYVAELDGAVVGTFQTTLLTAMTGRGASSLLIEAVQTRRDMRGKGIGEAMIRHAVEMGRAAGAGMAHLTSNNTRADAHRFYMRLGFKPSHTGFKRAL